MGLNPICQDVVSEIANRRACGSKPHLPTDELECYISRRITTFSRKWESGTNGGATRPAVRASRKQPTASPRPDARAMRHKHCPFCSLGRRVYPSRLAGVRHSRPRASRANTGRTWRILIGVPKKLEKPDHTREIAPSARTQAGSASSVGCHGRGRVCAVAARTCRRTSGH